VSADIQKSVARFKIIAEELERLRLIIGLVITAKAQRKADPLAADGPLDPGMARQCVDGPICQILKIHCDLFRTKRSRSFTSIIKCDLT